MISRIWHGWTTQANADTYESLLHNEIFVGIQNRQIEGYRGINLLRRDNWVVGIQAHHGNPYDGHTLHGVLEQVERLTNTRVKEAYCDRGYRGHNY